MRGPHVSPVSRLLPAAILALGLAPSACGTGVDATMMDGGVRTFPRVERVGHLAVSLSEFTDWTQLQVSAGFFELTQFSDFIPTIEHVDGPCHVSSMTGTYDPLNAPPGTYRQVSAGTVNVMAGAIPVALVPGTESRYESFFLRQARWQSGERWSAMVAGAEVPAFVTSLVIPSPPAVVSPVLALGGAPIPWVRGEPFVVRRRPGTTGTFVVNFNQNTVIQRTPTSFEIGPAVIVTCSFPPETETAIVPAAALRDYLPSSTVENLNTSVSFSTVHATSLMTGSYRVEVSARHGGPIGSVDVR